MGKGVGIAGGGREEWDMEPSRGVSFKAVLVLNFQGTQLFAFHLPKWRNSEELWGGLF